MHCQLYKRPRSLYEACDWLRFPRELMEGPSCMRFHCFYILVGPSRVNQNLPQRGDFCLARRASLSLFSKGSRQFSLAWACLEETWQAACRPGSHLSPRRSKSDAWERCLGQAALRRPHPNNPSLSSFGKGSRHLEEVAMVASSLRRSILVWCNQWGRNGGSMVAQGARPFGLP